MTVANRSLLVNAVLKDATENLNVPWDQFDLVLMWGAQLTDMFGVKAGLYTVPRADGSTKAIGVCVVDVGSPFDGVCQELGHAFGLDHELDYSTTAAQVAAGDTDYRDPYSVMSARAYGGTSPDFLRPSIAGLPDGDPYAAQASPFFQVPAQRISGPMTTPSQLLFYPWFDGSAHVVVVPQTYRQTPFTVTLFALDHARTLTASATLPVLASIDPVLTGNWLTFELRRHGQRYDQGIGDGSPPAAIVMHSVSVTDQRVRYTGVLPLDGGDLDFRAPLFTARLIERGPNDEWVKFQLLAGVFANQTSVSLEPPIVQATDGRGEPVGVLIDEPCLSGSYTFQEVRTDYVWTQLVTSYGFNAPKYHWYINGYLLTESPVAYQPLALGIEVFIPSDPTVFDTKVPRPETVNFTYRLAGNRLDLRLAGSPGNLTLAVKVVAYSDNPFEPVAVQDVRYLPATCLRYEWDADYKGQLARCYDWLNDVVEQEYPPILVDPGGPPFDVHDQDLPDVYRVLRAVEGLRIQGSERADQLVQYLGLRYNVPTADLERRPDTG